ncbi:type VII secretion target [Actinomadura alba]|uniref:Excreted virulence factor EspC, type VII ESX diderm n=1 Tax=Actinomadura alba TaxID=406431 RepID=A0ABR7LP53_9ACTN|nr:type VII secretion target [Actinomadura alba]MBC6466349.1 hypothetical protein [Actinomadura alba]
MAPNFTVKPAHMRSAAKEMRENIAPAYKLGGENITNGGKIDSPGFGIALSMLFLPAYIQKLDFLSKDMSGAHDVVKEIAQRLEAAATQYEKAENLNVSGFQGTPNSQASLSSAGGQALGSSGLLEVAGAGGAMIGTGVIQAAFTAMGAAGALSPAFIPAVIAAALAIPNIEDIHKAASNLSLTGASMGSKLNPAYEKAVTTATIGWEGEGRSAYITLNQTVKGHMDQIGKYVEALGGGLRTLEVALAGFWLAISAFIFPYLTWLIAMRIAQAFPLTAPAIEPIIAAASTAIASGVTTMIAGIIAVGGAVVTLVTALMKDALDLTAIPDSGAEGTPDMTEFKVGLNFSVPSGNLVD